MLVGCENVLEVGCGDEVSTRIIQQVVPNVVAIDFYKAFIENAKECMSIKWPIDFRLHNILSGQVKHTSFDGAVFIRCFGTH
mgnify:CR=1 FL=1